jgi:catalase
VIFALLCPKIFRGSDEAIHTEGRKDHQTARPKTAGFGALPVLIDAYYDSSILAKYPESAKAMQLIRSHPVSSGFENSTYNSLNAFRFINSKGAVVPVRWSMVPVQPFQPVKEPTEGDENYLFEALIASIHSHPLQWHLVVTIGQPEDPTNDPTIPWPPDRQQVDAGTLTIDHIESDDRSPARDINFDPLVLPDGIAPSDDPILSTRSAAYSVSFTRREGELKEPSAISTAETEE